MQENTTDIPIDNFQTEDFDPVPEKRIAESRAKRLPADFIGKTGEGTCQIPLPEKITVDSCLDEILVFARNKSATDVHIAVGSRIFFRISGILKAQSEGTLSEEQLQKMIRSVLDPEKLADFNATGDIEIVHVIEGVGRFRLTIVKKSPGGDLTIRLIQKQLFTFEESGMPQICRELINWSQGMVLVTGPIGCGKTTTLSVLCEMINQTRREHIISIEQPIEFVFTPKESQITQREIGVHTLSQNTALRSALRQDPDIIVISELRDATMIQLAATAAETGHLVLGTMNTNDAAQTILRLVNSFPSSGRTLVQNMISESLRGIICQQLIPKKDGKGVVAAFEVLLVNTAVSNLIRKGNIDQLVRIISTGSAEGMVTMDKSLMQLLKSGAISWEEACRRSTNKLDLEKLRYLRLT